MCLFVFGVVFLWFRVFAFVICFKWGVLCVLCPFLSVCVVRLSCIVFVCCCVVVLACLLCLFLFGLLLLCVCVCVV